MISNGNVITGVNEMNDFIRVMLGTFAIGGHSKYPVGFSFGNSPYPDLIDIISDDEDTAWTEADFPADWEVEPDPYYGGDDWQESDEYDYEPDVDEAQEWHDFDPDC